jgi:hypothetical protein
MYDLPSTGYVRLPTIIGDPKAVQIAEDCDVNLDQPAKVYRLH